jgi:hypothetical protein
MFPKVVPDAEKESVVPISVVEYMMFSVASPHLGMPRVYVGAKEGFYANAAEYRRWKDSQTTSEGNDDG